MNERDFEIVLSEALDRLPEEFRSKLENIDVVIEDMAPKEIVEAHGHKLILGLYQGVPITKRSHYYGGVLPDKISIYKNAILMISKDKEDCIRNIVKTLLHEIGHYFGINDAELRRLGY